MMKYLYVVIGVLVIVGYSFAAVRGLELPLTKKGAVQQGMRGATGGSRAFWVGGYRGGK